jgi:imidazolonepropionase-like amidohydrolase
MYPPLSTTVRKYRTPTPSHAPPPLKPSHSEFFEEKRLGKLWRRLKEEPLIPIGCAATVYALYQATKSIRQGDHHQTNRMFRARIYAQGVTLIALVAGSIFYKDDRLRRKRFETALEEKKAAEKREKWLKELEARDNEDREWRERFEGVAQRAKEVEERVKGEVRKGVERVEEEGVKEMAEERFRNKSVLEEVTSSGWGPGTWVSRTRRAWQRR